jgi:hypothetical protein
MVKGVSVGDLLEAYHKPALKAPSRVAATIAQAKPLKPLIAGLKKYKSDASVTKHTKLVALVDRMIKELEGQERALRDLPGNLKRLKTPVKKVEADAKKIVAGNGDFKAYRELWKDLEELAYGVGDFAFGQWWSVHAGLLNPKSRAMAFGDKDPSAVKGAAREIAGAMAELDGEIKKLLAGLG